MHSREIIEKRQLHSVAFHEDFMKIFAKTPEEVELSSLSQDFSAGKIDADYIAKLILFANAETWLGVTKTQFSFSDSVSGEMKKLFEEICQYVSDAKFSKNHFTTTASGITDYIVDKFSKTNFAILKTRKRLFR